MIKPILERYFPGVIRAARVYRGQRELTAAIPRTPMGFKFAGPPAMQSGSFEPDETALFDSIAQESAILINAGANVGYYCCRALARGKSVIAFEPITHNVGLLLRNISENQWSDRAEVFPIALSDAPGILKIFGAGTGASLVKGWAGIPESFATLVPINRIDSVLGQRVSGTQCLVVMDIEGSEYAALRGAANLLSQSPRPHWMVEITIGEHLPQGVTVNPNLVATFSLFWDLGYEAWTADAKPRLVGRPELTAIAAGGPDTLGTHNFLFVSPQNRPSMLKSVAGAASA